MGIRLGSAAVATRNRWRRRYRRKDARPHGEASGQKDQENNHAMNALHCNLLNMTRSKAFLVLI
jgi:hypothetical protein